MWRLLKRRPIHSTRFSDRAEHLVAEGFLLLVILALLVLTMAPSVLKVAGGIEESHPSRFEERGAITERRAQSAGSFSDRDPEVEDGASVDLRTATLEGGSTDKTAARIPSDGTGSDRGADEMRSSRAFMPLDFDLGAATGGEVTPSAAGSIVIRKALQANGQSLGSLRITIDRNSRLSVDAGELRKVLSVRRELAPKLEYVPEGGQIGLRMLRDLGVDMRYNATEDFLVLN